MVMRLKLIKGISYIIECWEQCQKYFQHENKISLLSLAKQNNLWEKGNHATQWWNISNVKLMSKFKNISQNKSIILH